MDDILCCSHNPLLIIDVLALTYDLKNKLVVLSTIYLGDDINKYQVKSDKSHWSILSTRYLKNLIKTVEELLKDEDVQLRKFKFDGRQPLMNGYQQELEQSNELIPDLVSCYVQLIEILRWAVELGSIEIFKEVALKSHYLASP